MDMVRISLLLLFASPPAAGAVPSSHFAELLRICETVI